MPYRYVQLRRRCQQKLDQFDLPRSFSMDALCDSVSRQRGRPLYLHPLPDQAAAAGACGLWLATATDDHIFFERHTVRLHQEHIVLHEIGHMLFDHHAVDTRTGSAILPDLFLDLDPRLVRRLLARTNYSTRQEQEAEMLASLIRAGDHGPGRERDGVLRNLGAALGVGDRW
ncbi:hypothetical protein [Streptomyces sp. NPDC059788]|uniref:hypothetical protein n=1 Tax=Streptomyces sp. NPDC059788 TaxID=3346948 RepID=UPI0036603E65